ncbi:prepilin-type N-terminal cleavage/methylation domain-containing protein [bacterium]|nr:prepilin-type N-terminal cleavage/methylation domain-containing protein [bacterium]
MKSEKPPFQASSRKSTSARGFTLVEMLVVITIIIALAAISFVATRSIKSKAHQTNAIAVLRQVATFNVAYATENNGSINTLRWVGDPLEGPNWVKNTFWGRLQPYMFPNATGSEKVLQKSIERELNALFNTDTAQDPPKTMPGTALAGAYIYGDRSGLAVPFSFNGDLAPWNRFARMSSVGDPSQLLYFTYGSAMFNESDGQEYAPIPRDGAKPAATNNIYFFDNQKAIGAFVDGHVELLAAPIPDRKIKIKTE